MRGLVQERENSFACRCIFSRYLRKLASVALPTTSTGLVTSALFAGSAIAALGSVAVGNTRAHGKR